MYILYRGVAIGGAGLPPGGGDQPCARPKTKKFLSKTSLYSLKYYKIARERKDRKE